MLKQPGNRNINNQNPVLAKHEGHHKYHSGGWEMRETFWHDVIICGAMGRAFEWRCGRGGQLDNYCHGQPLRHEARRPHRPRWESQSLASFPDVLSCFTPPVSHIERGSGWQWGKRFPPRTVSHAVVSRGESRGPGVKELAYGAYGSCINPLQPWLCVQVPFHTNSV